MSGNGKKKNIGLFVCHCGVNIASIVDVERVAKVMEDYPDVTFSTNYIYQINLFLGYMSQEAKAQELPGFFVNLLSRWY